MKTTDDQNPAGLTTDTIYAEELPEVAPFEFDDQVASVFQDMITRSVPGYAMSLQMISLISQRYARSDSYCYDLGCSLGASTLAIRQGLNTSRCKIIGVDNSAAMIERAKKQIRTAPAHSREHLDIEYRCADVRNVDIRRASLVALNLTLQFIPTEDKQALLDRIYAGMLGGGALILTEKIQSADPVTQTLLVDLYHSYKQSQGYSALEVAQKRSALENVLIPETLDTHRKRLEQAGFTQIHLWFQCFNFMSLLAVKN